MWAWGWGVDWDGDAWLAVGVARPRVGPWWRRLLGIVLVEIVRLDALFGRMRLSIRPWAVRGPFTCATVVVAGE